MSSIIQIYEFDSGLTHKTYNVVFGTHVIATTVTHDPSVVSLWVSETETIHKPILHRLIIGLAVDSGNPVSTLHLCVGLRCLIYQFPRSDYDVVPYRLIDFLADQQYTLVGFEIDSDLSKIQRDFLKFSTPVNAVDLRAMAAERYGRADLMAGEMTVEDLAAAVLGKEVERKPAAVVVSEWDRRPLTGDQVKYAAVAAFLAFEMGRVLNVREYRSN